MIPATSFYLLRHGESEANLNGVAAGGGVDSPLTDTGRQQARTLARVIDQLDIKPSMIFASPMKRAQETARIVNEVLDLPFQTVSHLEEHHIGDWEGQDWNKIRPLLHEGHIPPNGEGYEEYAHRVQRVLTPILERHYTAPPLIVAHGGTFHSIGLLYQWKIVAVRNCHLHRFDPHPYHASIPWKVWEFNPDADNLQQTQAVFCPTIETIS